MISPSLLSRSRNKRTATATHASAYLSIHRLYLTMIFENCTSIELLLEQSRGSTLMYGCKQ